MWLSILISGVIGLNQFQAKESTEIPDYIFDDIKRELKKMKISLKTLETPYVTIAGQKEKMGADFLVPNTKHYISVAYINCISKLL